MALVTRYFSTTAAGDGDGVGDGTPAGGWANRAALFVDDAGTMKWSTVITGFDFSGSDALQALIGPGNYTCGQTLASDLFANPPTAINMLHLHACDDSGSILSHPNPSWTAAEPCNWESPLPVITSATLGIINSPYAVPRLLKLITQSSNGNVVISDNADACVIENGGSLTNTRGFGGTAIANSVVRMNGTQFASAVSSIAPRAFNVRMEQTQQGVTGGYGASFSSTAFGYMDRCSAVGFSLAGFRSISDLDASRMGFFNRCLAVGCGIGFDLNKNAGRTRFDIIRGCLSADCTIGLDGQAVTTNSLLFENTTQTANLEHGLINELNYIVSGDIDDLFVNPLTGDYRIKASSPYFGKGIGIADELQGTEIVGSSFFSTSIR